jgi:choline dehydrogenase-like flavoprotein
VVEIASPDPKAAPRIAPNYLSDEADRRTAAAAIRQARAIMAQAPMQRYRPEEMRPGPVGDSDADLAHAAGDIGTTIFHPTCTVRMGSDDAAPLDAALRFRGVGSLRVVDASVMPKITSGNTNSPTIMIAEKAADLILSGS